MLYHRFCMTSCLLEVREISYLCIHLNSTPLYAMSLILVDMAYTQFVSLYSWYVPVGHTLHSNPRNALPAGQVAVKITHIYMIDKSRFYQSTFTRNRVRLKYKLNTFIISIFYLRCQKWSLKKCMAVIKKSKARLTFL